MASPVSMSESPADVTTTTKTMVNSSNTAAVSLDAIGSTGPLALPSSSEVKAGRDMMQTDHSSSPKRHDPLERKPSPAPSETVQSPAWQLNGTHPIPIPLYPASESRTETLEAKQEYMEVTIPRGLVGPEDRQNAGMPSDEACYLPPPVNGDTSKGTRVYSSGGRWPSREDGEISNGTPPNHKPPRSPQHTYSFVPCSHLHDLIRSRLLSHLSLPLLPRFSKWNALQDDSTSTTAAQPREELVISQSLVFASIIGVRPALVVSPSLAEPVTGPFLLVFIAAATSITTTSFVRFYAIMTTPTGSACVRVAECWTAE